MSNTASASKYQNMYLSGTVKTVQQRYDEIVNVGKSGGKLSEYWVYDLAELGTCLGKTHQEVFSVVISIELAQRQSKESETCKKK